MYCKGSKGKIEGSSDGAGEDLQRVFSVIANNSRKLIQDEKLFHHENGTSRISVTKLSYTTGCECPKYSGLKIHYQNTSQLKKTTPQH